MALAWLEQDHATHEPYSFRIDIGANRFWRVAVGDKRRRRSQGVSLLADPVWVSPLMGPLPEHAMGRTRFVAPPEHFDREARFMQLMSYRDSDRNGPAVSPIIEAHRGIGAGDLSPVTFSRVSHALGGGPHTAEAPRPMRWREAPRSEQMAVGAVLGGLASTIGPLIAQFGPMLLQALPSIAGIVGGAGPVVGQLLGALMPGQRGQQAQQAGQALAGLGNQGLRDDIANLTTLIQNAQNSGANAAATAGAAPTQGVAAPAPQAPVSASSLARARAMATSRSHRRAWSTQSGAHTRRSQAMVAPLAGLAAGQLLGPLLQQVLTPETVQQVLQMPNQHMQTIFNAMKDAGRLALESTEQELRHLRELNPGVDDPSLDALLQSMSIGLSRPDPGRQWIRAASVSLKLLETQTVTLGGRTASVYARNARLAFPLAVELPVGRDGRSPTVRGAVVQIQVKDAETLEILVNTETPVGDIMRSGRLEAVPALGADQTAGLPDGRDVLFCFTLIWNNARGEPRGAPLNHRARMSPELIFDRVEPGSETIALSEEARFGDYWHKFYGGRFRDGAKKFEIETRYVVALSPESAPVHHRLESVIGLKPVEGGIHRMKGPIRTGMEMSIAALARLTPILDPSAEPVPQTVIAALQDSSFAEEFNKVGRAAFSFRGSRDEAFELYSYPVMALDTILLKRPSSVDDNGQVTAFEDVRLRLAMPRAIAMFGVNVADRSQGSDRKLFEAQADLMQTRLVAAQSSRIRRRSGRHD